MADHSLPRPTDNAFLGGSVYGGSHEATYAGVTSFMRRRLTRDDARRRFAERIAAPESGIDFANETWRDARRKMADLVGTLNPTGCDRYDQLVAFEDAVLKAVDRDEAKRTVAELRRRVAERDRRDAFVAFLTEKREAKRLTLRLPWRDFVEAESLEAEEAFRAVSRNASGSRPRELYEDQLEILETQAARDRDAVVAALARAGALDVAATETNAPRSAAVRRALARTNPETLVAAGEKHIDAVEKSLRDIDAGGEKGENNTHGDDDTRARLRRACLDAVAVASSEDAARRRRRRRAAEAFAALLESSLRRRVVRSDWTFSEVSRKLAREPEWREMFERSADDADYGYAFAADAADRDAYEAEARAAFAAAFPAETAPEEGELEEGEAPDPKRARREPS